MQVKPVGLTGVLSVAVAGSDKNTGASNRPYGLAIWPADMETARSHM